MPSSFPTALDTLATTHVSGEIVSATTDNDQADAVNKIERAMRRIVNYVVAANDAPAAWKVLADYTCTGTSDHTTINTAITALGSQGGTVLLSPGTFNISGSASIPDLPITLLGSGWPTNLVMGSGMTTAALVVNGPTPSGSWGSVKQRVENLRIDGSAVASAAGAHGLEVAGAVLNGVYRELWITNCKGHSIYMHSASGGERPAYNLVDHCNVQNGSRDGIRLGDDFPAGTYAEHNDIRNTVVTFHSTASTFGIYATGNNNRITDCQFDFLQIGVEVAGGAQNTIKGCTFDRMISNCIVLSGQGNHSVTDNFFSDHITSGGALVNPGTNRGVSQINGCSGNTFMGNHFLLTSPAPWAQSFGEDSGCGSTSNYGPSSYIGNHVGNLSATQFSGTPPVWLGNVGQSMPSGLANLYTGSGAPSSGNGANGDFYFRQDTPGTANQRLYIKAAGSWTALTL